MGGSPRRKIDENDEMESYYELSSNDAETVRKALSVSHSQYGKTLDLASRFDSMIADANRNNRPLRIDYDTSSQIIDALREDISVAQKAIDTMRRECFGDSAHIEDEVDNI